MLSTPGDANLHEMDQGKPEDEVGYGSLTPELLL